MACPLSLRLNGHFPNGSGLASIRTSPFWILLELRMMEVVVTTGAIRRAKLQWNCHHQQTNTQFFYRPDVLPVTEPTVSEHWRKKWRGCSLKTSLPICVTMPILVPLGQTVCTWVGDNPENWGLLCNKRVCVFVCVGTAPWVGRHGWPQETRPSPTHVPLPNVVILH